MMYQIDIEGKGLFSLEPLKAEEIEEARRLCDACVGTNLYTEAELASAVAAEDRAFYLVKSEAGEIVGYVYYCLASLEELAKYTKLELSLFRSLCSDPERKVGKYQSIGIRPEYRGIGLSARMVSSVLKMMKDAGAEIAFGVCWKPVGVLPLAGVMSECRFTFLAEAKKVWYDDPDLICPYCKGRCTCDAEVYYKKLDGDTEDEA